MKILSVTLVFLFCFTFSKAEITADYSVAWLAHQSTLIAYATGIVETAEKGPGQLYFTRHQIRIVESLKGGMQDSLLEVFNYGYSSDCLWFEKHAQEDTFLIFLSRDKDDFSHLKGKWKLNERHYFKSIFWKEDSIQNLYSTDFTKVENLTQLLPLTLKQIKKESLLRQSNPKLIIQESMIEIPWDAVIFSEVWAGSVSFLIIPDYFFD